VTTSSDCHLRRDGTRPKEMGMHGIGDAGSVRTRPDRTAEFHRDDSSTGSVKPFRIAGDSVVPSTELG